MIHRTLFPTRRLVFTLLVLVMASIGSTVRAQPMRISAEERTKNLTEQLALDTEQAAKVLVILKKSEEDMKKLFESAEGDRESMRATMRTGREKTNKAIEGVLTAEQKKKFEEISKQGNRPPQGNRPGGR